MNTKVPKRFRGLTKRLSQKTVEFRTWIIPDLLSLRHLEATRFLHTPRKNTHFPLYILLKELTKFKCARTYLDN